MKNEKERQATFTITPLQLVMLRPEEEEAMVRKFNAGCSNGSRK